EDFRRGRIYLPGEDLDRFGVTERHLAAAVTAGAATREVRDLVAYECDRARAHYRAAAPGIELLHPGSRAGSRAAYRLYQATLDEIARSGHDVLRRRAVVSRPRQLALVAGCLVGGGTRNGRASGEPAPLP